MLPSTLGKVTPKKTKTSPFKMSATIDQIVVEAIWTLAEVNRKRVYKRAWTIPAATTARIPDKWSSSANQ